MLRFLAHRLASVVVSRTLTAPEWDPAANRRIAVEGGHPAEDQPGSCRIDRRDNPNDRGARRWVKDDSRDTPWVLITGYSRDAVPCLDDDQIGGWTRRQSLTDVARILDVT
jgi:hypothetical protein